MKTKVTVGAALLLTLGSALAGGMIYQKERPQSATMEADVMAIDAQVELTPDVIAHWKATAATAEYTPMMLPM